MSPHAAETSDEDNVQQLKIANINQTGLVHILTGYPWFILAIITGLVQIGNVNWLSSCYKLSGTDVET